LKSKTDNYEYIDNNYFKNNYSNKIIANSSPRNLIQDLAENNIIFKHMLYLITEQDYKFKQIENKTSLDEYIKNLDNTPVYVTYNCGVLYIPNKSN